ncbi:hypothetical protein [Streptomyces sp. NPDC053427]|uniref:hypothetical protein n=1 Tax=Streptomyces sp. NPDC053427 TaxID=3365701 RepID=UPI0037CD1A04
MTYGMTSRPAPNAEGAIPTTVRFDPSESLEIDRWILELRTRTGICWDKAEVIRWGKAEVIRWGKAEVVRWGKAEVIRERLRRARTPGSVLRDVLTARFYTS